MSKQFKPIPSFQKYEVTEDGTEFRTVDKHTLILPDKNTGGKKIYLSNDSGARLLVDIAGKVEEAWGKAPAKAVSSVKEEKPVKKQEKKKAVKPATKPVKAKGKAAPAKATKPAKKAAVKIDTAIPAKDAAYVEKVKAAKCSTTKKIWLLHKRGLNNDCINAIFKTKRASYVVWVYTVPDPHKAKKAEQIEI